MATKRKTGMVGSDDLAQSQVSEKLTRTPGFKTIDDVSVEQVSGGDQFTDEDSPSSAPPSMPAHPPAATVAATDAADYPWVCRHALLTGQDPGRNVAEARAEGAPADVVAKKGSGVWVTIDKVNPDTRAELEKITLITI